MRSAFVLLGVVLSVLPAGCSGQTKQPPDNIEAIPMHIAERLGTAAQWELYSLNPDWSLEKRPDDFHGHRILGKTKIAQPEIIQQLLNALKKGVSEHDGAEAMCFDPRHGIRVNHDGETTDLLICFECYRVRVYEKSQDPSSGFLVSRSPQPAFDKVLKDAGVPLPEPAKKRE